MRDILEYLDNLTGIELLIIRLVLIIIGGYIAVRILIYALRKLLKKSDRLDESMHAFILNAVKVTCYVILVTMALQALGVSMSTIVAVLGAAGAAIALALKDSLANIAGGVMIIFNHVFNKGDLITVGNDRGTVEKIDLFLTTLRTPDYKTITIPNGIINTSVVYNETERNIRRVDCRFSVSYDTDLGEAKKVLTDVCRSSGLILNDPSPFIGPVEHGDSAVVFEVLAYCKTDNLMETKYYLYEEVKKAFEKHNIEIPYPHLDVSIKSEPEI